MSFLSYEYRPEYDERKNSGLCEQAFETLETIIQQGSEQGIVSHSMKDGVVRRQLDVYESGEGEYSRLHTELQLVIEDYRSGPLRRMARLTLNDFIAIWQMTDAVTSREVK